MSMAIPRSVNAEVDKALEVVRAYDGPGLGAALANASKFLDEYDGGRLYVQIRADVIGGAVGGLCIGSIIGLAGAAILCPPAIPEVVLACGIIGGAGGAIAVGRSHYLSIKKSKIYDAWKAEAQRKDLYNVFQTYINSEAYSSYICGITQSLCQVPVKDGAGHLFEQMSIHNYIDRNGGSVMCPFRCGQVTKADFVYVDGYHRELFGKLMPKLSAGEVQEPVASGIQALHDAAVEINSEMAMEEMKVDMKGLMSGKVSRKDFDNKVDEVTRRFAVDGPKDE